MVALMANAHRHSAAASGTGVTSAQLSQTWSVSEVAEEVGPSSRSAPSDSTATGTKLYRADS